MGSFLPPIHSKKKAPEVGLFGDYVNGQDAMLVYDVDSDEDENGHSNKKANAKLTKPDR